LGFVVALRLPALDALLPGGAITTQALIEVIWLLIMCTGSWVAVRRIETVMAHGRTSRPR